MEFYATRSGDQFVDDRFYHHIQNRNLVMQFEIATRQRFQCDPVCCVHLAVSGHVRTPSGKGTGLLHTGEVPNIVSQIISPSSEGRSGAPVQQSFDGPRTRVVPEARPTSFSHSISVLGVAVLFLAKAACAAASASNSSDFQRARRSCLSGPVTCNTSTPA